MFTPQEIQEQTFSKAVFGGYDMQQVDDFLEPLTEDYITLYKENSVLKAKMKILVEKLEEYRAQETQQSSATAEAEAKSAQLLKQTQAKCAAMLQNAEVNAQANAQVNAANVQLAQLNQQIHAEQERLDYAKQTALNFISVIERDVQGHLGLLETLKSRDLTKEEAPAQPKSAHEKPYDWQADKTEPAPAPAPKPQKADPMPEADQYQKILDELRRVNDAIPDEEMSDKISRLEAVSAKIFEQAKSDPDKLPQMRKFMDYYLPTSLKLLNTYAELDKQGIEGENISESKHRIEQTMDTLVKAFEHQLDRLFASDALDVSTDIDVMQNMLRADGLTDDAPFKL